MSTAENLRDLIKSLSSAYVQVKGQGQSSFAVNIAKLVCGGDCDSCMKQLTGFGDINDFQTLSSAQLAKLEAICPCDCVELVVYQITELSSTSQLSDSEITNILNLSQEDFPLGLDREQIKTLFNGQSCQLQLSQRITAVASVMVESTGYITQQQSVNAVCAALSTDGVIEGVREMNESYTENIQKIIKQSVQKTFDENKRALIIMGCLTAVMGSVLLALYLKHRSHT
jgi:hypothetical protein